MANVEPPESGSSSVPQAIPTHADPWIQQFIRQFELNLLDASRNLSPEPSVSEMEEAAARAILETYLDSGMQFESAVELLGKVALEKLGVETESAPIAWSDELNQRRFALIDKEIQGTLTPAESVELAGLTRIMRDEIDSEANLPMQGARALHRKLLEIESAGSSD